MLAPPPAVGGGDGPPPVFPSGGPVHSELSSGSGVDPGLGQHQQLCTSELAQLSVDDDATGDAGAMDLGPAPEPAQQAAGSFVASDGGGGAASSGAGGGLSDEWEEGREPRNRRMTLASMRAMRDRRKEKLREANAMFMSVDYHAGDVYATQTMEGSLRRMGVSEDFVGPSSASMDSGQAERLHACRSSSRVSFSPDVVVAEVGQWD
jgi:hypothetical protein